MHFKRTDFIPAKRETTAFRGPVQFPRVGGVTLIFTLNKLVNMSYQVVRFGKGNPAQTVAIRAFPVKFCIVGQGWFCNLNPSPTAKRKRLNRNWFRRFSYAHMGILLCMLVLWWNWHFHHRFGERPAQASIWISRSIGRIEDTPNYYAYIRNRPSNPSWGRWPAVMWNMHLPRIRVTWNLQKEIWCGKMKCYIRFPFFSRKEAVMSGKRGDSVIRGGCEI